EKRTRKEIIDQRLAEAGWKVGDLSQVVEEYHVPQAYRGDVLQEPQAGYGYSDYVLLGKDGRPLAVIEAKKTSVDARVGEEQAKQYSLDIKARYQCDLPFCFYTNGFDIYFWNLGNFPPRKVAGFPTRRDLEQLQFLRAQKSLLANELINADIAGRPLPNPSYSFYYVRA
ncbi:MAG: restriction endonuclease subunit R, partial [Saprospiraceae bacterium]|nr:restriction endonuclease subunit R [Saprospiraceae bacterium]